jgi:hypothetical protein
LTGVGLLPFLTIYLTLEDDFSLVLGKDFSLVFDFDYDFPIKGQFF